MSVTKVNHIPEGYHTIAPLLVCKDAVAAIAFYVKAFHAVELSRLPGPDGKLIHAAVRIGNSNLMLAEEMPQWGSHGPSAQNPSPVMVNLYVEDADATLAKAVAAGATVDMPMADMFWGDRYGQITDPFGHRWSIATHVRDLTPEQIKQGLVEAMKG